MKKQRSFLRLLSLLPTLVILAVIFLFSAQTGEKSGGLSYTVSLWLVTLCDRLFGHGLSAAALAAQADTIHFFVRKAAHMTEYALLALSSTLPWFAYQAQKLRARLPVTFLFCVAAAALDEFHQSFVDGRGPSVADVGVDTVGVVLALVLFQIVYRINIASPKEKKR